MNNQKNNERQKGTIGLFTLVMITSALFLTLRNIPMMAETGMQMIFFNAIAAFAFLIPVALVSAELATGWPNNGVYHWVREAFNDRFGFVAVWLQWSQSMFGMTSILAYIAATLAYLFNPELAHNKFYIFSVVVIVYWIATFANFNGTKLSGLISSVCVIAGVFIPIIVMIIMGWVYASNGYSIHLDYSFTTDNFFPGIGQSKNLIMLLSFVFGFVGVEVSASHATEIKNVHRNYPIAIFIAVFIGFFLTLAAGFSLSFVLPPQNINLVSGAVQGFSVFSKVFNLPWLIPLSATLIAFGAIGQVSTWIVGPAKGLHAAARVGFLPKYFKEVNKKGVPRNILVFQACIISIVGASILILPSVNTSFLILTGVAVLLYSIMYCMMFISAIRLRYTQPDKNRPYKVPGGKIGIWIVAGIGLITVFACFCIGFIPTGISAYTYETIMIIGVLFIVLVPITISKFRKLEQKTEQ